MTLGELLSLLRGSILNDRTDRVAGTSDYLWTDDTLVMFIDEAQRRFAVQGLVLRDGSTDEVTKVTLVEGQTEYQLHEAVLAVISAKIEGQAYDLKRVGHSFLDSYRAPTDTWIDPVTYTTGAGRPVAFSTDEELSEDDCGSLSVVTLRVHPAPDASAAGSVVRLRVVRKPVEKLRATNPSQVPEIPQDHHIEMLDYAAYLALRIVDDDAGAARRALEFKALFEESVKEAKKSAMRKLFAPKGWGFGKAGFSWEH
jgi:hypothetical protein